MAEIFEIDDIPTASTSNVEQNKEKNVVVDKHMPNFEFNSYPDIENQDDHSPRIVDELWSKYEKQSNDEIGATNLRHEPLLLDRLI